jgi:hypothetical protein
LNTPPAAAGACDTGAIEYAQVGVGVGVGAGLLSLPQPRLQQASAIAAEIKRLGTVGSWGFVLANLTGSLAKRSRSNNDHPRSVATDILADSTAHARDSSAP